MKLKNMIQDEKEDVRDEANLESVSIISFTETKIDHE
jgi:hypothetical protein